LAGGKRTARRSAKAGKESLKVNLPISSPAEI
jgi:hypothetical protein